MICPEVIYIQGLHLIKITIFYKAIMTLFPIRKVREKETNDGQREITTSDIYI